MTRKYTEIAFTPLVKKLQTERGSREGYARLEQSQENDHIEPRLEEFIKARNGFYLGSKSEEGWPYIQFRGGPKGFLKVLGDRTLGFADFHGNGQYLSTANAMADDRVFLFLMDYGHRRRLKIWGRMEVIGLEHPLLEQLKDDQYPAQVQQGMVIHVEAWDWNCPQHIPIRLDADEVAAITEPLQARIAALEAQLLGRSLS